MKKKIDSSVLPKQQAHQADEAKEVEYCAFFNKTKHGEYEFLSNFYEHHVETPSGTFKSSEAYYQFQKYQHLNDQTIKNRFMNATAKKHGRYRAALSLKTKLIQMGSSKGNAKCVKREIQKIRA